MESTIKDFLRLSQALKIIPVGKSCWYEGVKAGRFPFPIKMGKVALYRVEDIEKIVRDISSAGKTTDTQSGGKHSGTPRRNLRMKKIQ